MADKFQSDRDAEEGQKVREFNMFKIHSKHNNYNNYTLDEIIAHGSFGIVYKGTHVHTGE